MKIAVDFDGTCVIHDYPNIGADIGAIPVLRDLNENGHQLILYTMRSEKELELAVVWCKNNDILLWGINENPDQYKWTKSKKIFANLYIDDAALGIPLIHNTELSHRPFVNWTNVRIMLKDKGLL